MDRTKIATNAEDALTGLERIYDDIAGSVTGPQPGVGVLVAAVDHAAGIFGIDGDDNITDAVLKAVDKLALQAAYIRDLANAKPTIDRSEMLDPSLEYLRLLRDAEERATKGETPDRIEALLHVADRYLADALHSAYQRRKNTGDTTGAEKPKATLRPVEAHPIPAGMADIRVPDYLAHALTGLRATVVSLRADYTDADVDGTVTQRIAQASALHGAGITPEALAAFLKIAAKGRVGASDVEALNRALGFLPKHPTDLDAVITRGIHVNDHILRTDDDGPEGILDPDLAPSDVADYGAKGDGITDDTDAIQRAIDSSN